MKAMLSHRSVLVGMALGAFIALWFAGLEYRSLFNPDEGRYAEIPREMLESGDWITPRLNGIKYFEKPPFQYWVTAAAYAAFGQHHWTSRLWTGLSGFLCLGLVFWMGKMLYGRAVGIISAAVLGSSFLFFVGAHVNTLDMGLTFWLTLGMAAFLSGQLAPAATRRRWLLLMWASLALGFLSKGPIAVVLPMMALLAHCALARDWRWLLRLELRWGVPLFALIVAPWFGAVSLANPEFPAFFFIHEHVDRFLTSAHGRNQPWWFFIPVIALGCAPWTGFLPSAVKDAWSKREISPQRLHYSRFLVVWIGCVFIFFSASGSKLPFYVLPMFPALAVLIARQVLAVPAMRARRLLWPAGALGVLFLGLAVGMEELWSQTETREMAIAWADSLAAAGFMLTVGCLACSALLAQWDKKLAWVVLAATTFLGYTAMLIDAEDFSARYSGFCTAAQLRRHALPHTTVYSVNTYDQTLPFYLRRTVRLVKFRGEMDFGLRNQPSDWLPDEDSFVAAWKGEPHAIALLDRRTYERLADRGVGMNVIHFDNQRVLVETGHAHEIDAFRCH